MLTIILVLFSITILIILLLWREHPQSSAKFMGDDAVEIDIPKTGLAGQSVIVVGGGISGLSASKYLLF